MNLSNIPDKIFDLLAVKSFEELTNEEKELALDSFTEEEYSSLHATIQEFMQADRSISPNLPIPIESDSKGGRIRKIVNYPVPLYQVAAVLLLLFGIYFMLPDYRAEASMDLTVVRDTIQQGTPISAERYPEKLIFHP